MTIEYQGVKRVVKFKTATLEVAVDGVYGVVQVEGGPVYETEPVLQYRYADDRLAFFETRNAVYEREK